MAEKKTKITVPSARLWGRGSSSNVQKVIWTARELGAPYERTDLGGTFGGTNTEAFRVLNPNRKVPVWEAADITLWESQAIMRHLARQSGALYGETPAQMAQVDCWLDWYALTFWPPIRHLFLDFHQKDRDPQGDASGHAALANARAAFEIASDQLARRRYLATDALSLADIALGIGVNRALGLGLGLSCPAPLAQWFLMATDRPGFALAIADDPTGADRHTP